MALIPGSNAEKIRDYFTTGAASLLDRTWGPDTKTLAEWFTLGNADLIHSEFNSISTGAELGLVTTQSGTVANSTLKSRLALADGFNVVPQSVLDRLNWVVDGADFSFGNPDAVASVEAILQGYPALLAAFDTLKVRDATINEWLTGGTGTPADVDLAIAGG